MNRKQRREQFAALVNECMKSLGGDYDRAFQAARIERPDLLDASADTLELTNEYDPSQPRDNQGRWTDTGSGGLAFTTKSGGKITIENGRYRIEKGTAKMDGEYRGYQNPDDQASASIRKAGSNPANFVQIKYSRALIPREHVAALDEGARRSEDFRSAATQAEHDRIEKGIPGIHDVLKEQTEVSDDFARHRTGMQRMMEDEKNDGLNPPRDPDKSRADRLDATLKANPRAALYLKAKRQAESAHWSDNAGTGSAGRNAMRILEDGGSEEDAAKALAQRREFVD